MDLDAAQSDSLTLPLCDLVYHCTQFTLWTSQAGQPGDELDDALTIFELSDEQLTVGSTCPTEVAQILNLDPQALQEHWIQELCRGGVDALWYQQHLHVICYTA